MFQLSPQKMYRSRLARRGREPSKRLRCSSQVKQTWATSQKNQSTILVKHTSDRHRQNPINDSSEEDISSPEQGVTHQNDPYVFDENDDAIGTVSPMVEEQSAGSDVTKQSSLHLELDSSKDSLFGEIDNDQDEDYNPKADEDLISLDGSEDDLSTSKDTPRGQPRKDHFNNNAKIQSQARGRHIQSTPPFHLEHTQRISGRGRGSGGPRFTTSTPHARHRSTIPASTVRHFNPTRRLSWDDEPSTPCASCDHCRNMPERLQKKRVQCTEQPQRQGIHVSTHIQQLVHDGFSAGCTIKKLSWTVGRGERYTNAKNIALTRYIHSYARSGDETAKSEVIMKAIETHFRTKMQSATRNMPAHRESTRRTGRKVTKAKHRLKGLEYVKKYSAAAKERIRRVLVQENMSSEDEDPENPKIFITRPVTWRSAKFNHVIGTCDESYALDVQSPASKQKTNERKKGHPSTKPRPCFVAPCDQWILKDDI